MRVDHIPSFLHVVYSVCVIVVVVFVVVVFVVVVVVLPGSTHFLFRRRGEGHFHMEFF